MTNATTLATGFLLAASAVVGLAAATAGRRPDDTHQIPLRMAGPFAVVRAQVAGHDAPLRLIVDTAAGATVLDRALAARLDLVDAAPGAAHVSGAGGAAHGITFGKATTLTIAGAQVEVRPVLADMAGMRHGDAGDGQEYDGILGNDVLRRFDVRFDVGAGVLTLSGPGDHVAGDGDAGCQSNGFGTGRPGHLQGFGLIDITATVPGAPGAPAALKAVVDTGAAQTVLNRAAIERLGYATDDPRLRRRDTGTRGIGGQEVDSWLTTIGEIRAGDWAVSGLEVRVAELPVFQPLGLADQPALILGIDALRGVPLSISAGVTSICVGPAARRPAA